MAERERPPPLDPQRLRRLPQSFSWLDRRLITGGFLHYLSREEICLYLFLAAAADKHGLSFWSPGKIGFALGLDAGEFEEALRGLAEAQLVACRHPFFQVLALPEKPVLSPRALRHFAARKGWA